MVWNTSMDQVDLFVNDSLNELFASKGMYNHTTVDESDYKLDITHKPTLFDTYPLSLLRFGAICCILISVWGIPANIITVIAFSRSSNLRNATSAFIINLCVADAIFCIFTPPLAASTFLNRTWVHGETLCRMFPVIRYSNLAVSLFTVVAIAINRYILIGHPRQYPKIFKARNIGIIIGVIWFLSLGLLFPSMIRVWGYLGFNEKVGTCTILKDKNGRSPKNMLFVLALVIPSVTFCICYSRIYWLVRKSSKNLREHNQIGLSNRQVNSIPTLTTTSSVSQTPPASRRFIIIGPKSSSLRARKSKQKRKLSSEMRVIRMILVIFCSYMICFVPITLVKLFQGEGALPFVNVLGYISVYCNACINPLIYVVMSKEYRSAYMSLLFCKPTEFNSRSRSS